MFNWQKLYRPKIIKTLIWLIPVFIFIWLVSKHFAIFGKIESNYKFGLAPSIITELEPSGRVGHPEKDLKTKEIYQRITGEPLYFGVKIPRMFKKIKLDLTYSAPSQPIIELGIKRSDKEFDYKFQTVQNKFLDGIEEGWKKIEDKERKLVLLQKGKIPEEIEKAVANEKEEQNQFKEPIEYIYDYETIDDFLNNLPQDKIIASYKFDLSNYLKLPDYQKTDKTTVINHFLRGKHEIRTYVKDEDLDFTFVFYDINRKIGPNRFNVNVYQGQKKIFAHTVEDDGNEEANGITLPPREYHLQIPNLPEREYKIELDINDDFIIKQIKTKQRYVVFAGRIFLAGNEEYQKEISDLVPKPTLAYGIGNNFSMRTFHPTGSQTIKIDNRSILLTAEDEDYTTISFEEQDSDSISNSTQFRTIYLPKNDVLIAGQYFVFEKSHYFDPNLGIKQVPLQNVKKINDVDYVIAFVDEYISPKKKGRWYQKEIEFDISRVYLEDNAIPFIISMPGYRGDIRIRNIKVALEKDPIWRNFFPRLKNYLSRKLQ